MKEILLSILNTYLIPALATFLTGFITWLGTKIKQKYEEKVQDETKKKIIESVVKFVEQKYGELQGTEKYQQAVQQSKIWLSSKGIELNDIEIETLIESAVYELKEKGNKND